MRLVTKELETGIVVAVLHPTMPRGWFEFMNVTSAVDLSKEIVLGGLDQTLKRRLHSGESDLLGDYVAEGEQPGDYTLINGAHGLAANPTTGLVGSVTDFTELRPHYDATIPEEQTAIPRFDSVPGRI